MKQPSAPLLVPAVFEPDIPNSFSMERIPNGSTPGGRPERLAFHRMLLIEQGAGIINIDDRRFEVTDRSLFLLSKGQLCLMDLAPGTEGYLLRFGDCFWERSPSSASNCKAVLFNNTTDHQQLQPDGQDFRDLRRLFASLHQEFTAPDYVNKMDALAAYLKIIMIKTANINADSLPEFDKYEKAVYRQFIELVSLQYKTNHEVGAYAVQLNLAPRRLSDLCKRVTGKTAKELINGYLVAEAKRVLLFSALPVKEIAYAFNFHSPEQFSHFFKRNTLLSPQQYRDNFLAAGKAGQVAVTAGT